MSGFSANELTKDAFLGGKLHLLQPCDGYRAGIDAVLLAAAVQAEPGQRVLELGCGVGTAILCLGARVPDLVCTGVERQADMADLAAQNGQQGLEVVCADLAALPLHVRDRQFDHVLANPPYYDRTASVSSKDTAREAAHGEHTPLAKWVSVAGKRLAPKGQATFIHRAERLPDLLGALPHDLGSVEVLPLTSRTGRVAERVILRARKNGRAAFRLHPPLILHQGAAHTQDGDSYVPRIRDVLRSGAPLIF